MYFNPASIKNKYVIKYEIKEKKIVEDGMVTGKLMIIKKRFKDSSK